MEKEKKSLEEIIVASQITKIGGRYSVLRLNSLPTSNDFFCVSKDEDEVTAIVLEGNEKSFPYVAIQKWYTLIEIRVSVPFFAIGFLARISGSLASNGINLLIVSTFSKDYVLVNEIDSEKAMRTLTNEGFKIA